MKNHSMKKKLMATSLMLVISILMMSTASFAWFTISTAPEIKGLETDVVVNDNLEIALAGGTATVPNASTGNDAQTGIQTAWGNIVDLSATADTADNTFDYASVEKTLRPVKLNAAKTGFEYPTYGADGRVSGFGPCYIVNDTTIQFGNIKDGDGNLYAYYVDFWLRTNVAGTISLTSTAVADRGTEGTDGAGSYFTTASTNGTAAAKAMFADNLQVAWQLLGTATPTYASGAITYSAVTPDTDAVITNFTKTAVDGDATKYTLSGDVVTGAVANNAYLVRVYVYLDGTNMQNMGASTTGTGLDITGALNLQFKHSATTMDPMDMPPAVAG